MSIITVKMTAQTGKKNAHSAHMCASGAVRVPVAAVAPCAVSVCVKKKRAGDPVHGGL